MSVHWAAHWTYAPETRRPPDWRESAACRGEDPDLFFPVGTTGPAVAQEREAAAICRRHCPVVQICGQWALATRQEHGVWGGMTEAQRRSILRHRKRSRS
jgi:WhiB family redox-sensing transcriptional regulator